MSIFFDTIGFNIVLFNGIGSLFSTRFSRKGQYDQAVLFVCSVRQFGAPDME